jgi:serine acetyltransferase
MWLINAVAKGTFPDYCAIVGVPTKIVKCYDENKKIWRI